MRLKLSSDDTVITKYKYAMMNVATLIDVCLVKIYRIHKISEIRTSIIT